MSGFKTWPPSFSVYALGKCQSLSKPQSPHLYRKHDDTSFTGLLDRGDKPAGVKALTSALTSLLHRSHCRVTQGCLTHPTKKIKPHFFFPAKIKQLSQSSSAMVSLYFSGWKFFSREFLIKYHLFNTHNYNCRVWKGEGKSKKPSQKIHLSKQKTKPGTSLVAPWLGGPANAGGPGFISWCGKILYVGGGDEIYAPQLLSPCSRAYVLQQRSPHAAIKTHCHQN